METKNNLLMIPKLEEYQNIELGTMFFACSDLQVH